MEIELKVHSSIRTKKIYAISDLDRPIQAPIIASNLASPQRISSTALACEARCSGPDPNRFRYRDKVVRETGHCCGERKISRQGWIPRVEKIDQTGRACIVAQRSQIAGALSLGLRSRQPGDGDAPRPEASQRIFDIA